MSSSKKKQTGSSNPNRQTTERKPASNSLSKKETGSEPTNVNATQDNNGKAPVPRQQAADIDRTENLWYRDGLKFSCTGCGDCCTGAPGYVWVNKAEIEALAAAIRIPVAEFERRYVRLVGIRKSLIEFKNGDCVFFHGESRKCQVYEVRPRQCRTWPFWPSNLGSPEAWEDTAERCRGCNRGRVVPLDRILSQSEEVWV